MKYSLKIITCVLVAFLMMNSGILLSAQKEDPDEKTAKIEFLKAKKLFYQKEWQKAAEQFDKIVTDFPDSSWVDDSLYWLGYSLNKITENVQDLNDVLEKKEEALKKLALLVERFPSSKWADDAKTLTVDIAEELAAKGLKDYKKYIIDSVKEETDAEMKLTALAALWSMDKEKALPKIKEIIRTSKNGKLKEGAIFLLGQSKDRAGTALLMEIIQNETDKEIKEHAVMALALVRTPESYDFLVKLYDKAGDSRLKEHLISAIAMFRSPQAAQELIRIYKKETDIKLKKQVVFWLGQNKSKEAQEFILKILEQ